MTDFTNLDDYMAALPADRQQTINDKAKVLSQSIELAKPRVKSWNTLRVMLAVWPKMPAV